MTAPSEPPNPALRGLTAYRVPRAPAPVDLLLDGNEGALPDAASLTQALAAEGPALWRTYPSPSPLQRELAAAHGVDPSRVIVTAGGDDVIDRLCRVALGGGRALLMPVPGFSMVAHYARVAGGQVSQIAWPDGPYPTEAVCAAITSEVGLAVVTSPNNPTGAVATADDIARVCQRAAEVGALVLVDLAYVEFADEDLTAPALLHDNAIVLRTFSKAWGLAGARVGYGIGHPRVIGWLRTAGAPYAVSAPGLAAVARARRDPEPMRAFVEHVRQARGAIADRLSGVGARVPASQANFVFARVRDPLWWRDAMAGLGIAVRAFPGQPDLHDALRIACPAEPGQLDRLLAAIDTVGAPQALLLDMDGVLVDVSGSYRRCIEETAAELGVRIGPEDIAAAKNAGDANNDWVLTHRLVRAAGVRVSLADVTRRFERRYQGGPGEPGLNESESALVETALLRALAAKVPLALVTGRPRADAEQALDRYGWRPLFRAVVCMEDGPAKPDPFPVRRALDLLGAQTGWMVGDTPDDARAARAAGVLPLAVRAPGAPPADDAVLHAAGAARVLDELATLLTWLPT